MRNVPDKSCRRNQSTHFVFNKGLFFFENRALYQIMWNNTVERRKPHMTIWRMRIACSIPKAIDTHSEYVILVAFPLQRWLHERTSMLRYTYIACHVLLWLQCNFFLNNKTTSWKLYLVKSGNDDDDSE